MMKQGQLTRQQLLHYIDMVSFAVLEANLFLDTHPGDQEAMEYFRNFNKLRNKAMDEYAERFTPLTISTASTSQERWKWVYGPWPWEGGDY